MADTAARRRGIWGDTTILGNMPDWNPAELIGILPSPLAASLYRLLITARTWQVARAAKAFSSPAAPVPLAWPGLHKAPAELS